MRNASSRGDIDVELDRGGAVVADIDVANGAVIQRRQLGESERKRFGRAGGAQHHRLRLGRGQRLHDAGAGESRRITHHLGPVAGLRNRGAL